jgi:hypothetical protein
MTKHPLTTAQIKQLAKRYTLDMYNGECSFEEDAVRAAADWQLEQLLIWIEFYLHRYLYVSDGVAEIYYDNLFKDLKKAMRPQEDNQ